MGCVKSAASFFFNFILGSAYLIGWVLLAVACGHNKWIYFNKTEQDEEPTVYLGKNYDCWAGLWQTCCKPEYWVDPPDTEDDVFCDANSFIWNDTANEHNHLIQGLPNTAYIRLELWTLRTTMLIAAGLPLFGLITILCGNRFCGYVSIIVAGMFGAMSILLGLFFSIEILGVPDDEVELPENEFKLYGEYGETTFILMGGVTVIWFFSLIDCILCSKYYRNMKNKVDDFNSYGMSNSPHKNPYAESIDSDAFSSSSL